MGGLQQDRADAVGEAVEAPVELDRLCGRRLHLGRPRRVQDERRGAGLGGDRLQAGCVATGDHELDPLGREATREGASDATGRAQHENGHFRLVRRLGVRSRRQARRWTGA
jgi:hypothetical protein